MIRPFNLRDLALIHRLSERGVMLQTQTALTTIPHPVRQAMVHMLVGGRYTTFVWKSDDHNGVGFAQLNFEADNPNAYLACIGTERIKNESLAEEGVDDAIWLPLLEDLAGEAGRHGVHSLVAEAAEDGPELSVLRQAGYAVYTRQDIWICDQTPTGETSDLLVTRQSVDDWDINVLYSNIVPGLIQSVEPAPPIGKGKNWVLRQDGELVAFIHICPGSVASWMRLLIHPNAHIKPRNIIEEAMRLQSPSPQHPVYCCVRRYQSWIQNPLSKAGFRLWGSQAVLVKHMVLHVEKKVQVTSPALEPQTVPGSSAPLIQRTEPFIKYQKSLKHN